MQDQLSKILGNFVAGCDSWVEIEEFSKVRIDWLRKFTPLKDGIPSHDTLGRVFSMLGADKFTEFMIAWSSHLREAAKGQIVAIDGKTLRRSFDRAAGPASQGWRRAGVGSRDRPVVAR